MSANLIGAIAAVAVLGFWMLGAYNRLVRLRQVMTAAFTLVDAQLRQRHELLGELIEASVVTLADMPEAADAVDAARRQARVAADHAAKRAASVGRMASLVLAEQVLRTAVSHLVTLVKVRPALRNDPRLREVMQNLSTTQHRLSAARDSFNAAVENYNFGVRQFPTRLIAGMLGFQAAGRL